MNDNNHQEWSALVCLFVYLALMIAINESLTVNSWITLYEWINNKSIKWMNESIMHPNGMMFLPTNNHNQQTNNKTFTCWDHKSALRVVITLSRRKPRTYRSYVLSRCIVPHQRWEPNLFCLLENLDGWSTPAIREQSCPWFESFFSFHLSVRLCPLCTETGSPPQKSEKIFVSHLLCKHLPRKAWKKSLEQWTACSIFAFTMACHQNDNFSGSIFGCEHNENEIFASNENFLTNFHLLPCSAGVTWKPKATQ